MQAIKTVQLTKKYKDVTAVDGLDLTARQGELFALLGVNGAGKTTTIKMLTCLTKPDSGNAFVNGNSIVTDVAAVKSIILLHVSVYWQKITIGIIMVAAVGIDTFRLKKIASK